MTDDDAAHENLADAEALLAYAGSNPEFQVGLIVDDFPLSRVEPEEGKWYYSAKCPKCRHDTPVFPDQLNGAFPNPLRGPGGFCFTCIRCGQDVRVPVKSVQPKVYLPWPEA